MRKNKGFTLIEVMIVVAIIGLLVAIAFPSLIRARLSANEASAKASIKAIITALENYRADQNPPTYPPDLASLGGWSPPYLDPILTSSQKQGFQFAYHVAPSININIVGTIYPVIPAYSLGAVPILAGSSGNITYYANSSGTIYQDTIAPHGDPGMAAYSPNPPAGFN